MNQDTHDLVRAALRGAVDVDVSATGLTPLRLPLSARAQSDSDWMRIAADDPGLFYLDGLDLLGADDLAELPDGLHPSPAGYLLIADRFAASPIVSTWISRARRGGTQETFEERREVSALT